MGSCLFVCATFPRYVYTLSLHDALPIFIPGCSLLLAVWFGYLLWSPGLDIRDGRHDRGRNGIWLGHGWLGGDRSEEHTSELQSHSELVCRLLLGTKSDRAASLGTLLLKP